MIKTIHTKKQENKLLLLQQGDEKGLNYFYNRYFTRILYRAQRATEDDCIGENIAQEAFFRLWLYRENIKTIEDITDFLHTQAKSAIHAYYYTTRHRFHRSLLRLDGIEDYQEFLLGYEVEEEDPIYLEQLEKEKQDRLTKLNALLPSLNQEQQLFIRLCLKFSFNYERIAYHLGGISDYEVGLRVEQCIETLRNVFSSSEKMNVAVKSNKITLEGEFDEHQEEIFRMRYELQYSFDQISDSLNLCASTVRKLFVQAHAKLKESKRIA